MDLDIYLSLMFRIGFTRSESHQYWMLSGIGSAINRNEFVSYMDSLPYVHSHSSWESSRCMNSRPYFELLFKSCLDTSNCFKTSPLFFFFYRVIFIVLFIYLFYYSFIHMCIHCLGHFSCYHSQSLTSPPTLSGRTNSRFSPVPLKSRNKQ
jgi:hypothetical protein